MCFKVDQTCGAEWKEVPKQDSDWDCKQVRSWPSEPPLQSSDITLTTGVLPLHLLWETQPCSPRKVGDGSGSGLKET